MTGNNYRQPISSTQYVSLATRPDITCKLAQFLTNLPRIRLKAKLRILRYLKGPSGKTFDLGGESTSLAGFSDSD